MYGVYCSCEPAPNDVARVHWRYVALAYALMQHSQHSHPLHSLKSISTFLLMPGRLIDWRVKVLLQQQKEKNCTWPKYLQSTPLAERLKERILLRQARRERWLLRCFKNATLLRSLSLSGKDCLPITTLLGSAQPGDAQPTHSVQCTAESATHATAGSHHGGTLACTHISNTACPARASAAQHDLHAL